MEWLLIESILWLMDDTLKRRLFSPHGIAMPKGLYFIAVVFSLPPLNLVNFGPETAEKGWRVFFFPSFFLFFCFRRRMCEVTERISTKTWTNIHV